MSLNIRSIGVAIPERVLTNADLEKMVDTSDEWIRERTGIKERRITQEPLSRLAFTAARDALERAGVEAGEIKIIIVTTFTGDHPLPATACILQEMLNAGTVPAFDLSAACSGFLYGLAVAQGMAERYSPMLIVSGERLSAVTDYQDRSTCVLFGDGAGAVVVDGRSEEGHELLDIIIRADGSGWKEIVIPAGGSAQPASETTVRDRLHYMRMNGREVFKNAVKRMEEVIREILERNNLRIEDVDLIVPHQANARIIKTLCERLKVPAEKTFINIDRYGNTSAASIPIALYEAEKEGRIRKGSLVVASSFGAGYTWGSALFRW